MADDPNTSDFKFLYDLRQRRAKVIGDQIDRVSLLATSTQYHYWFKSIEQLYTITQHAFKEKERDEIEKAYKKMKQDIFKLAQKHKSTWRGTHLDAEASEEIENKLRKLFAFVMLQIEDSGLFGTTEDDDSPV